MPNKIVTDQTEHPITYEIGNIFYNPDSINDMYILAEGDEGYLCISLLDGKAWTSACSVITTALKGLKFYGQDVNISINRN